ncbi:HAMP domain-containing histidine kinase [Pseudoflavitalea sp. G-6-1-2]|uniref:sensor histidine kinase n=1 Tax=Pseudoflavitalea sp. G-6-1-2 TaxID=2728841 RepID=UPI00146E5928|nr:HAMP domain-containing sensor histidine kinase [Pseudoflavitalea sp. G-6-1-2]NML19883.1 HAMP domain-containing histidine kinase [Pseudoflavitalea sp. G-6-1-2]
MTGRRIHIAAVLMVLAILAIVTFQCFWMYKNYREEEQTLKIRTNAIFRSAAYKLQAEKLKVDTNMQFFGTTSRLAEMSPMSTSPFRTVVVDTVSKSFPAKKSAVIAAPAKQAEKPKIFIRPVPGRQIVVKANADGNLDSLSWSGDLPLDSIKPERIRSISLSAPGKAVLTTVDKGPDSIVAVSITRGDNVMFRMPEQRTPDSHFRSIVDVSKVMREQLVRTDSGSIRVTRKGPPKEYLLLSRMMEDGSFKNLLQRVDSIADTISVAELESGFRQALIKENFGKLRFEVVKDSLSIRATGEPTDPTRSNEVTLGYSKPYYLRFGLTNAFQYISEKLAPQIVLSVLLIAITILSFVMLYRSLIKQRRLTQMKNDLISNITHELKTPIATVSVAIEALKSFHAMDDPRRTQEYLDISGSELQRLSLLVDKVLRLSMFEKQQVELRMEIFDLPQLAEEVISSMRLQFEKFHATVNLHCSEDDLSLNADRMHITSVIFNLLDNALKYSKEDPAITVSINRINDIIELKVSDNGIGIPAAYRQKVFEKFFRVPGGDTHNVKGYGLGLSYVSYVVERHKGKIEVESTPGKGSEFIIQLPRNI